MTTKNKGTTTPPRKGKPATILASRNLASFVDDYVTTTKAKQNIRKAITRKNPSKSYGEIYSNLYDFSHYVTFLCHCISFLLALSFGAIFVQQFGATVLGFAVATLLSYIIASVALGAMEWGQNTSLDTLFNVKFLTGRLPSGILVMCVGLSLISIISSTYSMSFLFSDNPLFARIGVGISLINELGIISLSYWRHAYEFKAEQEANLLNDLTHNFDYNSLFSQSVSTAANLPPVNYNQLNNSAAKIEIAEGAKTGNTKILAPSKFELQKYGKKYGIFKQQTNPLQATKTPQISTKKDSGANTPETLEKRVLTQLQADEGGKWTESQIQNNIKSYEGKLRKFGKSFSIVANLTFFKEYKKRFKAENQAGTMPRVEAVDRKKWYENNYSGTAAKLKASDKKKRIKK